MLYLIYETSSERVSDTGFDDFEKITCALGYVRSLKRAKELTIPNSDYSYEKIKKIGDKAPKTVTALY